MKDKLRVLFVILFTIFITFVFTLKPESLFFDDIVGNSYNSITSIKIEGSSDYVDKNSFIEDKFNYVFYKENIKNIEDTLIYDCLDSSGNILFKYINTTKENIVGFDVDGIITYYELAE